MEMSISCIRGGVKYLAQNLMKMIIYRINLSYMELNYSNFVFYIFNKKKAAFLFCFLII